jgi:hypothetical protein
MGKKERAEDAKKQKEAVKKERRSEAAKADPALPALTVTVVMAIGVVVFSDIFFQSQAEGRAHFFARLFCFTVLESGLGSLFSLLLLQPARRAVAWMPGGASSDETLPWGPTDEENISNDDTLAWPLPGAAAALPADWVKAAVGKKRAYHLNHVRGTLRLKHTAMRAGAALGSLGNAFVLSVLLDHRPVAALGLAPDATFAQDVALGVAVGFGLVAGMTAIELRLGWIRRLGWAETVDPRESFGLNLLVDALFHAFVSINEELPLRGWLLLNAAEACAAHLGFGLTASLLTAATAESAIFAFMHRGSSGSSTSGLLNLLLGGFAGAANALLSGSLAFSLGWHWAWNFTMGNVLGRSTSGIPISATVLSVAPHPSKTRQHGGAFGPEGGVLAPGAYLVGVLALYCIYGTSRWGVQGQYFPALAGTF